MTTFQPSGRLVQVGSLARLNSWAPLSYLGLSGPTGKGILAHAQSKVGSRYVLGTLVPKNDPSYTGNFDCSELAAWAIYKETGRLYGCDNNAGDPATANAYTGYFDRDARSQGQIISVSDAFKIPGAMLLRLAPDSPSSSAHIAISDGYGGTVEAMGTSQGVLATRDARGRPWSYGILPNIPGVTIKWEPTSEVLLKLDAGSQLAQKALPIAIAASAGLGVIGLVAFVSWTRRQRRRG